MTWQLEAIHKDAEFVDRLYDANDALRDWFQGLLNLPSDAAMDALYELDPSVIGVVVDTLDLALDPEQSSMVFDGRKLPLRLVVGHDDEVATVDLDEVLRVWFRRLLGLPESDPLIGGYELKPAVFDQVVTRLSWDVGPRDDDFFIEYCS